MKKYLSLIVIAGLVIVVVYQNKELKQYRLESRDITQDSLFILQNTVGRYELTLEMLREEDSVAASKFENILYNETE
jgi:hypothetical protein